VRFLITGGAGFIGSHSRNPCSRPDITFEIIDDLSTGSIANIDPFKSTAVSAMRFGLRLQRARGRRGGRPRRRRLPPGRGGRVMLIVESPVRTIETNIHANRDHPPLAAKKKRPVLVASTSEVYGKSRRIPYREEDDCVIGPPTRGRWSYAASKLVDEFLALSHWKERKLPTIPWSGSSTLSARADGRYGMVVPRFVSQAARGGADHGVRRRAAVALFRPVADVVEALTQLIMTKRAYGQVFTSAATARSRRRLAERVRRG